MILVVNGDYILHISTTISETIKLNIVDGACRVVGCLAYRVDCSSLIARSFSTLATYSANVFLCHAFCVYVCVSVYFMLYIMPSFVILITFTIMGMTSFILILFPLLILGEIISQKIVYVVL